MDHTNGQNIQFNTDASFMDQITDEFLHFNISHDPELVLQYKMLSFIFNKDYLKCIHLSWVWQEFLIQNPKVTLSSMELKLEFCLRVLGNLDKYKYLSPGQKNYFKGCVINKNADELLRECDLEEGIDYVYEDQNPILIPFDHLKKVGKVTDTQVQTGPIQICIDKNLNKDRSLIELLGSVFQTKGQPTLSVKEIQNRLHEGIHNKVNWNRNLQKHFTGEGPIDDPKSLPEPHQSSINVSTGAIRKGLRSQPISSTPISSRPMSLTRTNSQGSSTGHRPKSPRQASAERGGESLYRFTERLKKRTKPRRRH